MITFLQQINCFRQNKRKHSTTSSRESGVAILEFALVAGIFFMLILGIFEAGRYYTAQALITRGAQDALRIAKVSPEFRLDIQRIQTECLSLDQGQTQADCIKDRYEDFTHAREDIANKAAELALATIVSDPDSSGSLRLLSYTVDDSDLNIDTGGAQLELKHDNLKALILRPGDRGYIQAAQELEIPHPQVCSPSATNCSFPGITRQPEESLVMMYQKYPIIVRLSVQYDSLIPWVPSTIIHGVASGFREVGAQIQTGRFTDEATCLLTSSDCQGNFFLDPSCQCACGISDTECFGNKLVDQDKCVCDCTSQSEEKANCFGQSEFDYSSCACTCPASISCSSDSKAPTPGNGCGCSCDAANFPCAEEEKAQAKPDSSGGECECVCDLNKLNCPGYLKKDAEECACVCNEDSKAEAACWGRAEFDEDLCACSCPADVSCVSGLPNPAKGCTCACDPSTIECKKNEYVNTKDDQTGECECVCGITESNCQLGEVFDEENCLCACDPPRPATCPNGQTIIGCVCGCDLTQADCGGNYTLDPDLCQCVCNGQSETNANCGSKNAIFNSTSCQCECPNTGTICADNKPPSLANSCGCKCDPSKKTCPTYQKARATDGDPLGSCECYCAITQANCGSWKKPDMTTCSCLCDDAKNQTTCTNQGRAYNSTACSCGECLGSVADCALGEDFDTTTCKCKCNQTACPANQTRDNYCNAPCKCIPGAQANCLSNPTNTWNPSTCECKPLGSIGF